MMEIDEIFVTGIDVYKYDDDLNNNRLKFLSI